MEPPPVKVICAWCLEAGKPAVVREKEPLDDPEETHGVCADHRKALEAPARDSGAAPRPDSPAA